MRRPSRLDYAFAVGRVRALEKHLVSRAVFMEAAEEKDLPCAFKLIYDAGKFHSEQLELRHSGELDGFVAGESDQLFTGEKHIFLEEDILEIIRLGESPARMLERARSYGCPFIVDYARHVIDLANLKMFARSKYLDLEEEKLFGRLFTDGYLDASQFRQHYELSLVDWGGLLHATPYKAIWERAIDTLEERDTFIDLERGFEDFLMLYLRKAQLIVFGPEPVFAYVLAKLRELALVRLIGIGKLNKIPTDVLKYRISETYV